MVEYSSALDAVFHSLADPTRRDILRRVIRSELSVNEVAKAYDKHMTLAAVSKHIKVLESAKLIKKRRVGKQQFIAPSPQTLQDASGYLLRYRELWEDRFDRSEAILTNQNK